MSKTKIVEMPKAVEFIGRCGHGNDVETRLVLPITAEILNAADEGDDYEGDEWIVWLKSGRDWHVATIGGTTQCKIEAQMIFNSVRCYLATEAGQKEAAELCKHALCEVEAKNISGFKN